MSESLMQQARDDSTYDPVVARVNGRAIHKSEIAEILWQGRGRRILDEMVMLEAVRQQARTRQIEITPESVEEQLGRILQDMAPDKTRREQLMLLDYMLATRGMTRPEFDLIVERQAILRHLVDPNVVLDDQMITEEFERQYGRKVVVRALLVGNLQRMEQAQKKLAAGESFAAVVGQMSEDQTTLSQDGIWGPFTRRHEHIPSMVREAAWALETPGQRSEVVSYFDQDANRPWICQLELVQIIPAETVGLNEVRNELVTILKERHINERILQMQKELTDKAVVEIIDPILR